MSHHLDFVVDHTGLHLDLLHIRLSRVIQISKPIHIEYKITIKNSLSPHVQGHLQTYPPSAWAVRLPLAAAVALRFHSPGLFVEARLMILEV